MERKQSANHSAIQRKNDDWDEVHNQLMSVQKSGTSSEKIHRAIEQQSQISGLTVNFNIGETNLAGITNLQDLTSYRNQNRNILKVAGDSLHYSPKYSEGEVMKKYPKGSSTGIAELNKIKSDACNEAYQRALTVYNYLGVVPSLPPVDSTILSPNFNDSLVTVYDNIRNGNEPWDAEGNWVKVRGI
jgi:hypothetical protein